MVLRRPGSIHRKIAMNSNMEIRKSKKFKLRMKAKRERAGIKRKQVRVAPEDVGLLSTKAIKDKTRVNPVANIKLSKKKRNKILKQMRYMERDREEAQATEETEAAVAGSSRAGQMEVEKAPKKKASKSRVSGETMDCE